MKSKWQYLLLESNDKFWIMVKFMSAGFHNNDIKITKCDKNYKQTAELQYFLAGKHAVYKWKKLIIYKNTYNITK